VRDVLLVKTGDVAVAVRRAAGDYDRWFLRALGTAGRRFRVVQAHRGEPLPAPSPALGAVIVTGSPSSVREAAPWMCRTAAWLREVAAAGAPVLGVCFGHQLLAEAFGARVVRSPRGREIGTIACTLTEAGRADPLFAGVPGTFAAQATHEDEVVDSPPELELLASSAGSRVQAFRIGPRVRAVQFHPELDGATMRALVEARLPALEEEARARGDDPAARGRAALAGIREAPLARRVLVNFVERFG
jgi:GMP synthase (glutamine-hydrolysing)